MVREKLRNPVKVVSDAPVPEVARSPDPPKVERVVVEKPVEKQKIDLNYINMDDWFAARNRDLDQRKWKAEFSLALKSGTAPPVRPTMTSGPRATRRIHFRPTPKRAQEDQQFQRDLEDYLNENRDGEARTSDKVLRQRFIESILARINTKQSIALEISFRDCPEEKKLKDFLRKTRSYALPTVVVEEWFKMRVDGTVSKLRDSSEVKKCEKQIKAEIQLAGQGSSQASDPEVPGSTTPRTAPTSSLCQPVRTSKLSSSFGLVSVHSPTSSDESIPLDDPMDQSTLPDAATSQDQPMPAQEPSVHVRPTPDEPRLLHLRFLQESKRCPRRLIRNQATSRYLYSTTSGLKWFSVRIPSILKRSYGIKTKPEPRITTMFS